MHEPTLLGDRKLAPLLAAALLGAALAGCVDARDTDGDGTLDLDDPDDDNDGMPDTFEQAAGLDSRSFADGAGDLDDDGLSNRQEYETGTGLRVRDSDSDGVWDGNEVAHGLHPLDGADGPLDLDGDGLTNAFEQGLGSDIGLVDSDRDSMQDGWENANGLNPNDPADGQADADGDGLRNADEAATGADPHMPDTDGDTMPDGWEFAHGLDPADELDAGGDPDADSFDVDADGAVNLTETFTSAREYSMGTDPQNPDSDGDLIEDGYEWLCGLNPADSNDATGDPDGDGLTNENESRHGSLANRADSDMDRMSDAFEVRWGFDPRNASDAGDDADFDGLNNSEEAARGGVPTDPDTDDDGVADGDDADPARNVTLTLRIVYLNVTFGAQPTESGYDPPWEFSFVLTVNGVALSAWNFSLNASGAGSGETATLAVVFTFDPFDGDPSAVLALALYERDLAETVGVDGDDTLDLDPTLAGQVLDITLNLTDGSFDGDTDHGTADGGADGRGGEHDARIAFSVTLGGA